jgi:phosphate transport system substrate-binding protein
MIRLDKAQKLWWFVLFGVIILSSCKSKKVEEPTDTYKKGVIHISCDESFKPVIDQEVEVYESDYPDAQIIVHYKPEAECLKDLFVDSIRMIIATRGLSEGEKRFIIDSVGIGPEQKTIAHDLIAVIVNPQAKDTFFSMKEIRDLLTDKSKDNLIPVFDGARATSTVRFMIDSVLKGGNLGKNVVAAPSSVDVIDYVSKTPNAVGFVGYSWIGNPEDTAEVSYLKKVKEAYVESTDSANAYVKPSQYFIYTKSYPMVRDLVYVLKENYRGGLGHGFAYFLTSDPGQLIFRRAYLMPAIRPSYIRNAELDKH